jgi:hypothetical protein
MTIYDTNWVKHPEYLITSDYYTYDYRDIPKPKCLAKILEISKNLAKPFQQVRLDFYIVNNIPIIGEFTLTTGFEFFTKDFYTY